MKNEPHASADKVTVDIYPDTLLATVDTNCISKLLVSMHANNVQLWREGEHLHFKATHGLAPEEISLLRALQEDFRKALCTPGLSRAPVPATFNQLATWNSLQPADAWPYVCQFMLHVRGELRLSTLKGCFETLLCRHEALRTRFVRIGSMLAQQIDGSTDPSITLVDLERESEAISEQHARYYADDLLNQPMSLDRGPLLDIHVLSLAKQSHVLILRLHHLITDAFSTNLMFRELWLLYLCELTGEKDPPLPNASQCAHYAVWQHTMNDTWRLRNGNYWDEKLKGGVRARLPMHSHREDRPCGVSVISVDYSVTFLKELRDVALQSRTWPGVVFVAAYVATLARWCSQRSLVVPLRVTGRHLPEHRCMMGFIAPLLYLRVDLIGNESFFDLVEMVRQEFDTSQRHADFGRMHVDRPDLYSTEINWQSWSTEELIGIPQPPARSILQKHFSIERFKATPEIIYRGRPEFDVALVAVQDSALTVSAVYRTELFTHLDMQHFMQALKASSEQMIQAPGKSVIESLRPIPIYQ